MIARSYAQPRRLGVFVGYLCLRFGLLGLRQKLAPPIVAHDNPEFRHWDAVITNPFRREGGFRHPSNCSNCNSAELPL